MSRHVTALNEVVHWCLCPQTKTASVVSKLTSDFAALSSKYDESEVHYRRQINRLMAEIKRLKTVNERGPVADMNLATVEVFYDVCPPLFQRNSAVNRYISQSPARCHRVTPVDSSATVHVLRGSLLDDEFIDRHSA
jgi:hypothetical protein